MEPESAQPDDNDSSSEALLSPGFTSYTDIAAKLGPFDPPRDFHHGEEFADEPPRTVPRRLWTGSYAQRRRGNVRTLFVMGIGCVVFWPMPFVQTLSFYLLPLAYLHWLGLALIAFGIIGFFRNLLPNGEFKYVTEGRPLIGRVLTPALQPTGTPDIPMVALAAAVEYVHPETGQQANSTLTSSLSMTGSDTPRYSQTIEAGDYVTLVTLPDSFDASLRLYGYLGLDPDREYILKDGRPLQGTSASAAVLIAVGILAGVGVLLAGMHVVLTSIPSDGAPWKFIAAGIAGLVVALMLWAIVRFRRRQAEGEPTGASLGPIISGILGTMAGLIGICLINSQFDKSPGLYDTVEVVNFWETTHNFVFRTYEIEFRAPGMADTDKYHATIDDIDRLSSSDIGFVSELAVMDYAEGALGLEWTRGIYPIVWVEAGSVSVDGPVEAILQVPVGGQLMDTKIIPVIMIDEDDIAAPDEDLARQALEFLKRNPPFGGQIANEDNS